LSSKETEDRETTVERFALLAERGYVRKRADESGTDGAMKFLHDVRIV
jgi:hypothetical protein